MMYAVIEAPTDLSCSAIQKFARNPSSVEKTILDFAAFLLSFTDSRTTSPAPVMLEFQKLMRSFARRGWRPPSQPLPPH